MRTGLLALVSLLTLAAFTNCYRGEPFPDGCQISQAFPTDRNHVTLIFNNDLDINQANDASFYSVQSLDGSEQIDVISAEASVSTPNRVIVTTSEMRDGVVYSVTVAGDRTNDTPDDDGIRVIGLETLCDNVSIQFQGVNTIPPVIEALQPPTNSSVEDLLRIQMESEDDTGIRKVTIIVNGVEIETIFPELDENGNLPADFDLDYAVPPSLLQDGIVTVKVVVQDSDGNETEQEVVVAYNGPCDEPGDCDFTPVAPTLLSPADGSNTCNDRPTFNWGAITGITVYEVEVYEGVNVASLPLDLTTGTLVGGYPEYTSPPFTPDLNQTLESGEDYVWRVRGFGDDNNPWSDPWVIRIGAADVPTLQLPADTTTLCDVTPELQWSPPTSGDPTFDLRLCQVLDSDGDCDTSDPGTRSENLFTGTIYNVAQSLAQGTWYWQVRLNQDCVGPWSNTFSFDIQGVPAPTPLTPADGSGSCVTSSVNLNWSSVPEADEYVVQWAFDTNTSFLPGPDFGTATVTATTFSINAASLSGGSTYIWRVSGRNAACNTDADAIWSDVWSFGANTIPAPARLDPVAGETVCTNTPELTWDPSAQAASYDVRICDAADCSGIINLTTSGVVTTSFTPAVNLPNGTYFWGIRVFEGSCYGAWSAPLDTFQVDRLSPPIQQTPADGTTDCNAQPTLSWSPGSGTIAGYRVEVSTDISNFTTGLVASTTLSGMGSTTWQVDPPLTTGTYYWRVASQNAQCTGEWQANPFQFDVQTIATPVHVSPPNYGAAGPPAGSILCTDAERAITLSWNSVAGTGITYEIEIADETTFDPAGANFDSQSGLTGTTFSTNLADSPRNTTYYWRVRASTASCAGAWSSPWQIRWARVNQSGSLTPSSGTFCFDTVQYQWTPGNGATRFDIQTSTTTTFATTVSNGTVSGLTAGTTNWTTSPLPNGTYYWRLRTYNTDCPGDWSSAVGPFTVQVVAAPTPYLPTSGSNTCDTSPILQWFELGTTYDAYQIQIDTTNSFNGTQLRTTEAINVTATFTPGTIGSPTPLAPADFISPAANEPDDAVSRTVLSPSQTVLNYHIDTDILIDEAGDQATKLSTGTWYWRVRGENSTCSPGPWTPAQSLNVNSTTAPGRQDPNPADTPNAGDNTFCPDPRLEIRWDTVAGASCYDLVLDDDNAMGADSIEITGLTDTFVQIDRNTGEVFAGGTASQGTFASLAAANAPSERYWWVRAFTNSCDSEGCVGFFNGPYTYELIPPMPAPSGLTAPTEVCNNTITLDWNAVTNAAFYRIQLSTDNTNWTNWATSATNSVTINGFNEDEWFWRVRAENGKCQSDYTSSSPATFRYFRPDGVNQQSPANNSTFCYVGDGSMAEPYHVLTWSQGNDVDRYELEMRPQASGPWTAIEFVEVTDTDLTDGIGCSAGTCQVEMDAARIATFNAAFNTDPTYDEEFNDGWRWRIRAINDDGCDNVTGARNVTIRDVGTPDAIVMTQNPTMTCDMYGAFTYDWTPLGNPPKWGDEYFFEVVTSTNGAVYDTGWIANTISLVEKDFQGATLVGPPFLDNGSYITRVRARNTATLCESDFTADRTFDVNVTNTPSVSSIAAIGGAMCGTPPCTDLEICTLTPSVTWNAPATPATDQYQYRLEVSVNADFDPLLYVRDDVLALGNAIPNGLLAGGNTYYARVMVYDEVSGCPLGTTSQPSDSWSFIPRVITPGTLNAPGNGNSNTGTAVTFRWNGPWIGQSQATPEAWTVRVFSDAALTNPTCSRLLNEPLAGTYEWNDSINTCGLQANTRYYWYVELSDGCFNTTLSPVWNFCTGATCP